MLLRKISLNNIGLFKGAHEFDLTPKKRYRKIRPVTLIGGMNGAGKTTILNSLRLCLYGNESLARGTTKKGYQEYLSSLIHRSNAKKESINYASVEVEFEFTYLGIKDVYLVTREWSKLIEGVEEKLLIKKNDKKLKDLIPDQWQTFIKDLIPPGLSGLFFFDGEKIQNLADDIQGSNELATSIKALLGLDLADRLKVDLKNYTSKQRITGNNKDLAKQERQAKKRLLELLDLEEVLDREFAAINSKKTLIEGKVEAEERSLTSQGGDFVKERSELQAEDIALAEKDTQLQDEIRTACADLLPFSIAPELCKDVVSQFESESKYHQQQVIENEFKNAKQASRQMKKTLISGGLSEENAKEALRVFRRWLSGRTNKNSQAAISLIHNMGPNDMAECSLLLKKALGGTPEKIKHLAKTLETVIDKKRTIASTLTKMPTQESLAPIFQALSKLNKDLAKYSQELALLEQKQRDICNSKADIERQLSKIESQKTLKKGSELKVSLAEKSILAMNDYIALLTERKIRHLNDIALEKFNYLARKRNKFKSIIIDPDKFTVNLYDKKETKIPMSELSAGEKQILAVSILWALSCTSGRSLPVVIDTPLGRLDSSHRSNLTENYFTQASHQIIILSTDTEFDKLLEDKLSSHISNYYRLEYNEKEKRTYSHEGYFWKTGVQK